MALAAAGGAASIIILTILHTSDLRQHRRLRSWIILLQRRRSHQNNLGFGFAGLALVRIASLWIVI